MNDSEQARQQRARQLGESVAAFLFSDGSGRTGERLMLAGADAVPLPGTIGWSREDVVAAVLTIAMNTGTP